MVRQLSIFSCRLSVLAIVYASAMLAAALIVQYVFYMPPCYWCLWQRVPYGVMIGLGLLGAWRQGRWLVWGVGLCLVSVAVLALYHTGIEQGVFENISGCSSVAGETSSLDAMRAAIMDAPLVSCDQPTAVFFGLSLAAWHALMSSGVAVFYILWQWRQSRG